MNGSTDSAQQVQIYERNARSFLLTEPLDVFNFMTFLHWLSAVHVKRLDERFQDMRKRKKKCSTKSGNGECGGKESFGKWKLTQQVDDDKLLGKRKKAKRRAKLVG